MKSGKMTSVLIIGAAMLLAACGGGGDSGTTTPVSTPTAALTVTLASGSNSGTGTVTSNPAGLTCAPNPNPTSCTGAFPQGSQVTLTANPTTNHAFAGWSGASSGVGCTGAGTCVLTMNAAKAVTATFNGPTPNPVVSLSVTGSGAAGSSVTSDIGGINCPGSCTSVGLTNAAPVTLTATAAPGAFFQGWTGGSCTGPVNPCTFTPTANIAITATFIKPTITMTVTGAGSVSSTPGGINTCTSTAPCSAQFNYDSTVTLTATIPGGHVFSGWSFVGAPPAGTTCTGVQSPCTIPNLIADVAVTAAFNVFVATPTVTVNFANSNGGTGSVSSSGGTANFTNCGTGPCVATYVSGTAASITAAPAAGSVFAGWTAGPCNGTAANPCIVNPIIADQVMTAVFTRPVLNLTMVGAGTVSSSGSVTGTNTNCTSSCTRIFNSGETVTLTGSPTGGFAFQGWTGGLGSCTGGATSSCSFTMPAAGAVVTATFNQVSAVQNFQFIGAVGRELLAVNPASPASPTPVQVSGANVVLPAFSGQANDGASLLNSASYNSTTQSFENIQASKVIFTSGGRVYKASALVSDGVPGVAGTNVPQQVSSLTTAQNCGMGSLPDLANATNRVIGFYDAGGDGICNNGNEHLVLMHLSDSSGTAAVSLPVGTQIDGEAWVFDLATGAMIRAFVTNAAGDLQWIDNTLALPPQTVSGGAGVGSVVTVGTQVDKVFLATERSLYIYTPSTNTLSAPVVTADGGQTWVLWSDGGPKVVTDLNAIYLVQTNGDVYRVPLSTTAGTPIAKHFTATGVTAAADVKQTPNKVMILTGTAPYGSGGQHPCSTTNPTTCNNGILAVDKAAPNTSVAIEAAAANKVIWTMAPFNNYILYTLNTGGAGGGALARIENASSAAVIVSNGSWNEGTLASSFSLVTIDRVMVNMLLTEQTGPTPNGALIKVVTSPTGSPVTIGTVSDPANLLQYAPFFQESENTAFIGFSNLLANLATTQPFFVDATFNSLTKIITPGDAANWREINTN